MTVAAAQLEAATRQWLESLRFRSLDLGPGLRYGADLALAVSAPALVDADREREGVRLLPGDLVIDRLEAVADGMVELSADLTFPPDEADDPASIAPGRILGELHVGLGPVYFAASGPDLEIVDYTRQGLRMSAMWCTHPEGEDARGGIAAVPQAVTVEAHRGGRIFLEVSNALERDLVLRVGRPDRPKGWFARQPAVGPPDVGISLAAHGSTHLAGVTRRSKFTEVELFAFDAATREPVAALVVPIELPRGHPGEHGQWCG